MARFLSKELDATDLFGFSVKLAEQVPDVSTQEMYDMLLDLDYVKED